MENRTINLAVVAEVAKALQDTKDKMVFVGGAVVSLYTDDEAADEVRPTADIDMTVLIVNLGEWSKLQEDLANLNFYPDPFGHAICSYKYDNILIDIMPSEDGLFGPANKWYRYGFDNLKTVKVHNEEIKILPAPCFLATKFEAFNDRGTDYRTSHDIEDIIYVIDNRLDIVNEIAKAHIDVKNFIRSEFNKIISQDLLSEILISHIHPIMIDQRMSLVLEKIEKILNN